MNYKFTVPQGEIDKFNTQFLSDVTNAINRACLAAKGPTESFAKAVVSQLIRDSEDIKNLLTGELQGEFGVVDPEKTIDSVVAIICARLRVEFTSFIKGKEIVGQLITEFYPSPISAFSVNNSAYITAKGATISWLDWFLTKGDRPIVKGWTYQVGPNQRSRTGLGVMVRAKNEAWGVPSEFAGVEANNFITRALYLAPKPVGEYFIEEFVRQFRI